MSSADANRSGVTIRAASSATPTGSLGIGKAPGLLFHSPATARDLWKWEHFLSMQAGSGAPSRVPVPSPGSPSDAGGLRTCLSAGLLRYFPRDPPQVLLDEGKVTSGFVDLVLFSFLGVLDCFKDGAKVLLRHCRLRGGTKRFIGTIRRRRGDRVLINLSLALGGRGHGYEEPQAQRQRPLSAGGGLNPMGRCQFPNPLRCLSKSMWHCITPIAEGGI
ncbi:hypothetical protein NDU88_004789 [Pleurodeles waltl]|uniref:Uncharacterized protein n=1 Tax=Pleurodeles waltl TaxID=8319 RepID=A0AAV7NM07_PLEWA|nr:hypothetical protein NDU88_004789 [Pleurodeles waltl]